MGLYIFYQNIYIKNFLNIAKHRFCFMLFSTAKSMKDENLLSLLVNYKIEPKLKVLYSGDIVGSSICCPRYVVEKKNKFKTHLEVNFKFSSIARKHVSRIVRNRLRKQKALFVLFSRIWFDTFFISKVIHFCFPKTKQKCNVYSFFKVIKVGFGLFSELVAPNCISFLLLKNSGKFYRRKGLYYLIKNFKIKYKRLAPKRRLHRKKRKNK